MFVRRILRSQHYHAFLRSENSPINPSAGSPSISFKPFSALAELQPQNTVENSPNNPLSIAEGILGEIPETQVEETVADGKLGNLEGETRLLENTTSNPETLKEKDESESAYTAFVKHLFENGYFRGFSAVPRNRFDIAWYKKSFAKDYVRFAAEQFGSDNPEIAKLLSGSDLKEVAQFGCPSLAKKVVLAAKGLRRFFGIEESTVCEKCVLKQSCKFFNQNGRSKNFNLALVMKVAPLYVLDSVHPQLVVPQQIKDSASRLLKETVNLSRTVTQSHSSHNGSSPSQQDCQKGNIL